MSEPRVEPPVPRIDSIRNDPNARAVHLVVARTGAEPEPQWGEAYLLFDGQYLSLDDLLRASDD